MVCLYVGRPENQPHEFSTATLSTKRPFWHFNVAWLASRERDYPNDAPSWQEMTEWFEACLLIAFGGAALGTGIITLLIKPLTRRQPPMAVLFLALAFILGLLGPSVFSAWLDGFLFTWPASLFAAFQATVLACIWAEQQKGSRYRRWLARLAILSFVLVAYGFFVMCKAIGMYIGWSFLFGYVLAFPFAFLAARAEVHRHWLIIRALWTLLAFAAFFWSCQALLLWKAA
jgi:hypothetical protein